MSVAHDPTQPFRVDTFTCYAERALAMVRRRASEEHKSDRQGWDDGLHYYVVPHED